VVILAIGGTNVHPIDGGTNVVVAVALLSSGAYDSGKKVVASSKLLFPLNQVSLRKRGLDKKT
jgi:hypothetical protein